MEKIERDEWRKGLRSAAAKHKVVFTTLPVRDLIHPDELVLVLGEEGFHLEPSEDLAATMKDPVHGLGE